MAQLLCGINKICKAESKNGYCLNDKNTERLSKLSSSKKYTNDEQDIIYNTKQLKTQVDYLQDVVNKAEYLFTTWDNSHDEDIVFQRLLLEAKFLTISVHKTLSHYLNRIVKLQSKINTLLNLKKQIDNIVLQLNAQLQSITLDENHVKIRSIIKESSTMIRQQGNAVRNFSGTCGLCSICNGINRYGKHIPEKQMIYIAKRLQLCEAKDADPNNNGGTTPGTRQALIMHLGYKCDSMFNQSLEDIARRLDEGQSAIINLNADVLCAHIGWNKLTPIATNHVVTIVDVEIDVNGSPKGLWVHDTGVHSDMGNLFFCNIDDYEIWKNTPNCFVQYIYQ